MSQDFKNQGKSITFVSIIIILIAMSSSIATAAIIDNGVIQIGVNDLGHLNVAGGTTSLGGTTVVGLRYMALNTEATAQGSPAEGWGAADSTSGVTGYANRGVSTAGTSLVSFTNNSSEATSIVNIPNSISPKLRVTHYYHPTSNTSNLYQVDVSILNVGSTTVNLKYRRVMDWDIEPTAFSEYVTINNGSVAELTNTTNNGFNTANVLVPATGTSSNPKYGSFTDHGPYDQGASFDFDFGIVEPGQTKNFKTFYGATANESEALLAIGLVNAEAYSLGQTSTDPTGGTPNTFIFAFGGLGEAPSDSTPPLIIINTPLNGSVINDSTPELNATFGGETVAYTWYNVNNTGNSTLSASTNNLTVNLPYLPEGVHNVTVYANDSVGNLNSNIVYFIVDRTPPTAPTIDVPANGETLAAYTWVNGTTDTDATNVTVYVNGVIRNDSVAVLANQFNISNVPLGADGDHEINVSAKDAAGNVNTTNATVSVNVDATSPTLTISSPLEGHIYNTNTTSLNVTADEIIDTWLYNINSTGNVTFPSNQTISNLPDGNHNITVFANDSAGNMGSAMVNFTVDTTDPVIHNVSLSDTSPGYGQQIVVNVNVTDTSMNSVTAGSKSLTHQSGALWNGTITAGYGTNTVTVTAHDNASNTATNSNLSYTGPDAPTDSGGSSGGGVGTSDEPENVEETVVLRIYLQAGGSSTYNFNNVVTSVEVTPEKTYGLVAAKIEVLHGQPGSITTDPPTGEIYKYVNVFIGTSGWFEDKFSSSVINFQLPASWFEDNNIDPASVTLYRHYGDEWQPLATTMTGQAGGHYQYSSPTPGFSTFMILGQVRDSSTVEPVATPDSDTVAGSTATPEATSTSDKGIPGFGVLLGIMGVLVAVYSIRK